MTTTMTPRPPRGRWRQANVWAGELTVLIRTLTDPAAILDRITARLGLDWQAPAAA